MRSERAPAKINLTLRIGRRRPDGYHDLESLVVFAQVGDVLRLDPGPSLDLDVDGKVQKVLLRDLQRHPYKQIVMHVDFQRIDESAPIRFKVPLHFVNQDTSPAGKLAGVVITHELNDVEVLALPKDLPEFIEVDLSELKLGDIVHLSSLKLAPGVSIPQLKLGKEHDLAVVIARQARAVEDEVAAAPAAAEVPSTKAAKAAIAPASASTKDKPVKKDKKK